MIPSPNLAALFEFAYPSTERIRECPLCRFDDPQYADTEYDWGDIIEFFHCTACGFSWTERYTFVDWKPTDFTFHTGRT